MKTKTPVKNCKKLSGGDWDDFYIEKRSADHTSSIADHIKGRGHNEIKWDYFETLASGKTDCHCKMKRNLVNAET